MKTTIRKMGKSQGVILPKPLLAQVGLEDEAEMVVEDHAIVIRRPRRVTTGGKPAPYRIPVTFGGKKGLILLDQITTLDQARLIKRVGAVRDRTLYPEDSAEVFTT